MRIIYDKPPVFERAREVFGPQVENAIFCWGSDIYSPRGLPISEPLLEHEQIHCYQQKAYPKGIEGWWDEYLTDPKFRLCEEIPAHKMEYQVYCKADHTRIERRLYLKAIAQRLSGPFYGHLIHFDKAYDLIKGNINAVSPEKKMARKT